VADLAAAGWSVSAVEPTTDALEDAFRQAVVGAGPGTCGMSGLFVLRREVRALVRLPQTYGIGVAYLIISGIFFVNI